MEKMIRRSEAIQEIKDFVFEETPTAGLCYFRGRRRVGKSTILEYLSTAHSKCFFYFMGRLDEKASKTLNRCAQVWDQFTGRADLKRFKSSELTWDLFFEAVIKYSKDLNSNLCLAFDEIQWIAKEQSGFLGALKQHWIKIEKIPQIKIIICGSSYKFFQEMTGGEEKLIRGLKTRADIWLNPFSLREIHRFYIPKFTEEELLLAYGILGGIPYYWNQIDRSQNFIQAINKTCFTKGSIFLEEYVELLNLEFQKNGVQTISRILEHINGGGKTASTLAKDARLPDSTVGDLVEKLENYQLLFKKTPLFGKSKENSRGALYYLKDFYLNFYFRVLSKYKRRIQRNTKNDLLFSKVIEASPQGYYISNFTGPIFELIVQTILETSIDRNESIFRKLQLKNCDFEVGFHWDKKVQFDLIIYNASDRVLRFIECKWTRDREQIVNTIKTFSLRISLLNLDVPYQQALCLSHKPSVSITNIAEKENVILITPKDLY